MISDGRGGLGMTRKAMENGGAKVGSKIPQKVVANSCAALLFCIAIKQKPLKGLRDDKNVN